MSVKLEVSWLRFVAILIVILIGECQAGSVMAQVCCVNDGSSHSRVKRSKGKRTG